MTLGTADAADKKARRHTLRFHTSKIEGASARRQSARVALGGDDDLPYSERRKEREARTRVKREVQAGQCGQGGDNPDDTDPALLKHATGGADAGEEDESEEENVDGYYSLIRRQRESRRKSRSWRTRLPRQQTGASSSPTFSFAPLTPIP